MNCTLSNDIRLVFLISLFEIRRVARDEAELKRKKSQQSGSTTPTKGLFHLSSRKNHSPTTPTNDPAEDDDDDDDTYVLHAMPTASTSNITLVSSIVALFCSQMRPVEGTVITDNADVSESRSLCFYNTLLTRTRCQICMLNEPIHGRAMISSIHLLSLRVARAIRPRRRIPTMISTNSFVT